MSHVQEAGVDRRPRSAARASISRRRRRRSVEQYIDATIESSTDPECKAAAEGAKGLGATHEHAQRTHTRSLPPNPYARAITALLGLALIMGWVWESWPRARLPTIRAARRQYVRRARGEAGALKPVLALIPPGRRCGRSCVDALSEPDRHQRCGARAVGSDRSRVPRHGRARAGAWDDHGAHRLPDTSAILKPLNAAYCNAPSASPTCRARASTR